RAELGAEDVGEVDGVERAFFKELVRRPKPAAVHRAGLHERRRAQSVTRTAPDGRRRKEQGRPGSLRSEGARRTILRAGFRTAQADRATTNERMLEQKCDRAPCVGTGSL